MTTNNINANRGQKLGAWTAAENDIHAAAYLDMLARELRAEKYNKAATRRAGLAAMADSRADELRRTPGSWEMKACNVSAVMRAAGLPWINGYKPLGHGQARPLAKALYMVMLSTGWNDADLDAMQALAQEVTP